MEERLLTSALALTFLVTLTLFGAFWVSIGGFATARATPSLAASLR